MTWKMMSSSKQPNLITATHRMHGSRPVAPWPVKLHRNSDLERGLQRKGLGEVEKRTVSLLRRVLVARSKRRQHCAGQSGRRTLAFEALAARCLGEGNCSAGARSMEAAADSRLLHGGSGSFITFTRGKAGCWASRRSTRRRT